MKMKNNEAAITELEALIRILTANGASKKRLAVLNAELSELKGSGC
jgi:hypothetical protein